MGRLREWLTSADEHDKHPSLSDALLGVVEEVARIVASRLPHCDAKVRRDCRKLTVAIHQGFGAALLLVDWDGVDNFLKKSGALFESVFQPARKRIRPRGAH